MKGSSVRLATLALLLIGCSSSPSTPAATPGQSTAPHATSTASSAATSTATTAATTTAISTATSITPPDTARADVTTAVTAAFTTFFDGADPDIDAKVASLEGGEALRSMVADAMGDPQFANLSTEVRSVQPLDQPACAAAGEQSPCALVVHDLFLGAMPAFVGLQSHAVQVNGRWLVSRSSWCAIVEIGGAACPVA